MDKDQAVAVCVVGGGPAGLSAALHCRARGLSVVVFEATRRVGLKLLASGGGRCNVTNTLSITEIAEAFGRHGRFAMPALRMLGADELRTWLSGLGVATHAPDGFHVFPVTHRASTVCDALMQALALAGVEVHTRCPVRELLIEHGSVRGVVSEAGVMRTSAVIIATGGCGYPDLGGSLSGYTLAESAGHTVTPLYPAMVPLVVEERWPGQCRAHTIPGVILQFSGGGRRRRSRAGDLIFTRDGLAGPVVLDFSREVSPFLAAGSSLPLHLCLTGSNQAEWDVRISEALRLGPRMELRRFLAQYRVPPPLAEVFCAEAGLPGDRLLGNAGRKGLHRLAAALGRLTVHVSGSAGFPSAMVTRGGVSLSEVEPRSLESRLVRGLHFAGETLDLDGPCGGFNLQWAFSSGCLAGTMAGPC